MNCGNIERACFTISPLASLNSEGERKQQHSRFYTVFGLNISSEIMLSELDRSGEEPFVFIRMTSEDFTDPEMKQRLCHGEYNSKEAIVSFKDVGSFRVRGGTNIEIWKDPCADDRLIRMFLHGVVSAILLHQRGFLVLHGSCMDIRHRAVGFLGRSGAGKSTMAAALHQRGHDILSEDIVAIEYRDGRSVTYPGIPQLKLTADTITGLGYSEQFVESLYPVSNEFLYRYDRKMSSSECMEMRCIFVVRDADQINIRPLSHLDGFMALMQNSYTAKIIERTHSQASHFSRCTRLIEKIPICLLERPRDMGKLADVAKCVEAFVMDLPSCPRENPQP
jgi:hypothetical protein